MLQQNFTPVAFGFGLSSHGRLVGSIVIECIYNKLFSILLLNAFDAMKNLPANERKVDVWIKPDGENRLKVGLRDWGSGVPDETVDKVFEPSYTTKHDGVGMGLAISRSSSKYMAENSVLNRTTQSLRLHYFTVPS